MATVYLGRLSGIAGFEKLVAIKVIHPHLVAQKNFVEMFLDEARLSAKIHHPNLVEVFEVGEVDDLYFMVAELVRGRSLSQLLEATGRSGRYLTPPMYITIIARVCDALHSSHNVTGEDGSPLGLVHRDVSPSNILVSYDGIVKVIDFGIAFAKDRTAKTESGVVKGKLDYMAPEQLRNKAVDRRTDVFSVGVVLYELATGRHPFCANDEGERLERQLKCMATPPREIVPEISPELDRTILKALSENPENRHQSTKEFGEELRNLMVPPNSLLDQQAIADFMSLLFDHEIVEDNELFESATEKRFSARQSEIIHPKPFGDREASSGREASGQETISPETDVLTQRFVYSKKTTAYRILLLLIVSSVVFAVVLIAWQSRHTIMASLNDNKQSKKETTEKIDTLSSEPVEIPVAEIDGQEEDIRKMELDTDKTFKIRFIGLPALAKVTLNNVEATIHDDHITLPPDGVQRVLKISAKGYKTYIREIKPVMDSEVLVELEKSGTRLRDNRNKTPKGPSNKLQTCPYCE